MRTRLMIMAIVFAAVTAAIGVVALLVLTLGWLGLAMGALGTTMILVVYRRWIQPWQHRWGATDQEAHRAMPGDDRIPDAASTTRAIAIAAPPEQVWPWLVQLGYGRRLVQLRLDRQRRPASADRLLPELQQLQLGDQILMAAEMGLIPGAPAQPPLRRRRPRGRRLVPGPVSDPGRLPAGASVASALADDPGHGVLDPAE